MLQKQFSLIVVLCLALSGVWAQMPQDEPWGFAVCTSLSDSTRYPLTGGNGGRSITLVSDGQDMRQRIMNALRDYDEVVLDGSQGDFIVSSTIRLADMRNKTIRGVNGARLCTERVFGNDVHHLLDSLGVLQLSTQADGRIFTLSNGAQVKEECEAAVRQAFIRYFNDPQEHYRQCGIFSLVRCENFIIRYLEFAGPGAVDISGDDLLNALDHTRHLWVDHCSFMDGVDGNFDITTFSDLITVSWCHFCYSSRSYQHMNTNLIGSSDNADNNGVDALNITYAYCHWGEGCKQRMPMARFGTIHLLNCYYDCVGCGLAVNARSLSELLIEGCYFARGVKRIFSASDDAKAYSFLGNVFEESFTPADKGDVRVPYLYTCVPAENVADLILGNVSSLPEEWTISHPADTLRLLNGVLVVEKNGRRYTLTGQLLR